MAWTGNDNIPNEKQEDKNRSNKLKPLNRAKQVSRDVDKMKNFTVSILDIDETIIAYLKDLQISVVDDGNKIQVPIMYGSPETWKSVKKDGILRDNNGKIILPLVMLKRVGMEKDTSMQMFNKYLQYTVMKTYTPKNKYTHFTALNGKNTPVHEIFNITMPDHMLFNYEFMVWTEYIEQSNEILERINFETDDYWGSKDGGLRFRTHIDNYIHTVEVGVEDDRLVRTEFTLTAHGYLLPDTTEFAGTRRPTTVKSITPKKVILGTEMISAGFSQEQFDDNREKWRSQYYPNLQKDEVPPGPPTSFSPDFTPTGNP